MEIIKFKIEDKEFVINRFDRQFIVNGEWYGQKQEAELNSPMILFQFFKERLDELLLKKINLEDK